MKILPLLFVAALSLGCGRRTGPPSATSESESLQHELIASLRTDLEVMRNAKPPAAGHIQQLAQVIDMVMREKPDSPGGGSSSWNTSVLAYGSKKSADLAAEYLKRQQKAQAATASAAETRAEQSAARIGIYMFEAKTASELDAPVQELAAAISQLPQSGGLESTSHQLLIFQRNLLMWQKQLAQRETGDPLAALRTVENLRAFSDPLPQWTDKTAFSKAVAQANQAMGLPTREKLDADIKQLTEKALAASKAEELDPLLVETRKFKTFRDHLPEGGSRRLSSLESLLTTLQNGLLAKQRGDAPKFRECLGHLELPDYADLGISRSRLLEYTYQARQSTAAPGARSAAPAASPEAVAARMTTFDAILPNLPALQLAVDSDLSLPDGTAWRMDLLCLQGLQRQAAQLTAGRGLQRAVHEIALGMTKVPAIAELQRQFDILGLNITFAEDTALPPLPGETARAYVARLKPRLVQLGKWELLQTLYTATRALKMMEPLITGDDDAAASSFLYGIRMATEAKDLRMATCAFQSVLTLPSTLVPAEIVGQRLTAIRAADPKAYQQGSEMALNISRAEGKRAPGERIPSLVWIIPARMAKDTR